MNLQTYVWKVIICNYASDDIPSSITITTAQINDDALFKDRIFYLMALICQYFSTTVHHTAVVVGNDSRARVGRGVSVVCLSVIAT